MKLIFWIESALSHLLTLGRSTNLRIGFLINLLRAPLVFWYFRNIKAFQPIELPAQISIEFDPPLSSAADLAQKLVQEPESSESQSETAPSLEICPPSPPLTSISPVSNDAQTTSSTSQGFLSIDSGVRLRCSSQDSHHSVPKSWSDFESEAKTWKVNYFRQEIQTTFTWKINASEYLPDMEGASSVANPGQEFSYALSFALPLVLKLRFQNHGSSLNPPVN